jgi:hypothetical protein
MVVIPPPLLPPPLLRCSRSSAAYPYRTALHFCRMQVLPPPWCRRCRRCAACCHSRSALFTACYVQSNRSSPMADETSAAVGLRTGHAQGCTRLVLALLRPLPQWCSLWSRRLPSPHCPPPSGHLLAVWGLRLLLGVVVCSAGSPP